MDNSVFLLSYNQLHYIEAKPYSHNVGSVLSFDKEYFELLDHDSRNLFGTFTKNPSYYLDAEIGTLVNWNLAQIKREMAGNRPKAETVIFNYVRLILISLFRSSNADSEIASPRRATALRLLSELEINFKEKKTASAYANMLSMSVKQLNRICQAEFGTNLLRLIHQRINLEAKRLLVYTRSSIKEIGYDVGFEDQAHFSNFFKKLNGESPENFRKSISDIYK